MGLLRRPVSVASTAAIPLSIPFQMLTFIYFDSIEHYLTGSNIYI